jgi:regulator of sigma E protease
MEIFFGVLVGFLLLMLLVLAHELGHFLMARRNGVEVEEFGVGFPPAAVKWQKRNGKWKKLKKEEWASAVGKSLILSWNWLPIGGFCKMKGESDDDERKGSFGSATLWGKTKILFGGAVYNWVFAAVIFTFISLVGMPYFMPGQFGVGDDMKINANPVMIKGVMEGSPAEEAGLMEGDRLVKIGTENIIIIQSVSVYNANHAGREVAVVYERDGEQRETSVRLNERGSKYLLGVEMSQEGGMASFQATWSAPIVGVGTMVQLTGETFKGLGQMLWNLMSGLARQLSFSGEVREEGREAIGEAGEGVTGPVGIVGQIFPMFLQSGIINLMLLTGIISLSLACMNVLPIPALDGGRWLLIMIYRLRKKKLPKEVEEKVVGRAFVVLIGLIILITILDIRRFF